MAGCCPQWRGSRPGGDNKCLKEPSPVICFVFLGIVLNFSLSNATFAGSRPDGGNECLKEPSSDLSSAQPSSFKHPSSHPSQHCLRSQSVQIFSSADLPWLIWNWNIRIELWIFYQPSRQLWHTITVKSKMLQEDQLSKLDLLHLWCYFSTDISADCIIKESPNVPRSPLFLLKRKGANIITKCQFQALGTKRFQTGPEPTSVTQTGFSLVCALKYFLR